MQGWPLTVDRIIDHAARRHGGQSIVWRSDDGTVQRTVYRAIADTARQVSHALVEAGVRRGDRVATLAWNDAPHLAIWYGIMGIGAVCHTLNPRIPAAQLGWMMDHADDRLIFVAADQLPLLRQALPTDRSHHPQVVVLPGTVRARDEHALHLTDWLRDRPVALADGAPAWGQFTEETAAGLCYTSGTTGDPKGVLYSHRSNFLHTFVTLQADVFGLAAGDVVMPIVPMFHANAWGLAFSAPAVGAKLVMPGRQLDPKSLVDLIQSEGVTFAAGVPTIWETLLQYLDETGAPLGRLRRIVVGGASCPEGMIRAFAVRGVEVRHAWGMTEVSPLGTIGTPPGHLANADLDAQLAFRLKQGRPPLGVDIAIVDEAGQPLAEDGVTPGRLLVRGAAVISRYFGADDAAVDDHGFFDTGDVATIDGDGGMAITDRAKDIVKSGGEWISSLAIENLASAHRSVRRAAVIGIADAKWGERPLLLVEPKPGAPDLVAELTRILADALPRWWVPKIEIVAEIPLGSTGKVDKKVLRASRSSSVDEATR